MKTRITTTFVATALMLAGVSALAQTPTDHSAMAGDSMTCQQMMDKAKPMVGQMSDQKMMGKAQKEMTKAQSAMEAGNMKTCKMHMNKVMKMTTSTE